MSANSSNQNDTSGQDRAPFAVTQRKPWATPVVSTLGFRSTETFVTKSYTVDHHFISSNYGTPAS